MNPDKLSKYRGEIMGIATVMILVGHSIFYGQGAINWGIFNDLFTLGYSGVDLFLFVSGFGLVNSISRNDIKTFYRHRIDRLMPSVIFIVVLYAIINFRSISLSWLNPNFWFQNYWYIGFCIFSYSLFPIIFRWCNNRNGYLSLFVSIIVSLILLMPFIIKGEAQSTAYTCFITRIPVFILGTLFAIGKCKQVFSIKVSSVLLIIGLIGLIPFKLNNDLGGNTYFNTYYSILLITPPILLTYCKVLYYIPVKLNDVLNWIGKRSLEIYLIQVTVMPRLMAKMIKEGFTQLLVICMSFSAVLVLAIIMHDVTTRYSKIIQSKL